MLQSIPTRISGASILRQSASRRSDGSAVLVRRLSDRGRIASIQHEECITADFAFTCEPSFDLTPAERVVRCLAGELFLCMVDVRVGSPTFGQWQDIFLQEGDCRLLVLPAGVALGWQVLSERGTIEIRATCEVDPSQLQSLRWNDRDLVIEWPERPARLASQPRPSRHLRSIPDHQLPGRQNSPSRSRQQVRRSGSADPRVRANRDQPTPKESTMPNSDVPANQTSGSAVRSKQRTIAPDSKSPGVPHRDRELILVIGSSGQLGRDLCRHLRPLGTVIGACRAPARETLLPIPMFVDVSRPATIRQVIRQVRPTLIVNAAALTDVDQAESTPRLAQLINANAPSLIAEEAGRIGAGIVHFCSSMVFDGSGERPWRETDAACPQNQYARTKWIGTQAISNSQVPHLILRCGWLYSTHGDNYVRRLIEALAYRPTLALPDDHLGTPTSTNYIAGLVANLLGRSGGNNRSEAWAPITRWLSEHGGLYHAATLGTASRLEVGDQVLSVCRQHALPMVLRSLQGRPLTELSGLAKIPANCALDPSRLAVKFNLEIPRWQADLGQQIEYMLSGHRAGLSSVA